MVDKLEFWVYNGCVVCLHSEKSGISQSQVRGEVKLCTRIKHFNAKTAERTLCLKQESNSSTRKKVLKINRQGAESAEARKNRQDVTERCLRLLVTIAEVRQRFRLNRPAISRCTVAIVSQTKLNFCELTRSVAEIASRKRPHV